MTPAQAVWLGIVQGLTEFLPISSSAHLILVRELFGWDAGAAEIPFDVACHLGTLTAVLAYFRRDVLALAAAAPAALTGGGGDAARTGRLILLATASLVPLGLLLSGHVDRLRGPAVVAATLALGAAAMLWADRGGAPSRRASSLSAGDALVLGCAQAAALVPGGLAVGRDHHGGPAPGAVPARGGPFRLSPRHSRHRRRGAAGGAHARG